MKIVYKTANNWHYYDVGSNLLKQQKKSDTLNNGKGNVAMYLFLFLGWQNIKM